MPRANRAAARSAPRSGACPSRPSTAAIVSPASSCVHAPCAVRPYWAACHRVPSSGATSPACPCGIMAPEASGRLHVAQSGARPAGAGRAVARRRHPARAHRRDRQDHAERRLRLAVGRSRAWAAFARPAVADLARGARCRHHAARPRAARGSTTWRRARSTAAPGASSCRMSTPPRKRVELVDRVKYPPLGHRSSGGLLPHFGYKPMNGGEAARLVNEDVLTVVMIETPKAIANADAIAAVPGVDVLLIGTGDLTLELGISGDYGNPQVIVGLRDGDRRLPQARQMARHGRRRQRRVHAALHRHGDAHDPRRAATSISCWPARSAARRCCARRNSPRRRRKT